MQGDLDKSAECRFPFTSLAPIHYTFLYRTLQKYYLFLNMYRKTAYGSELFIAVHTPFSSIVDSLLLGNSILGSASENDIFVNI